MAGMIFNSSSTVKDEMKTALQTMLNKIQLFYLKILYILLPRLNIGWSCYICSPITLMKSAIFSRLKLEPLSFSFNSLSLMLDLHLEF